MLEILQKVLENLQTLIELRILLKLLHQPLSPATGGFLVIILSAQAFEESTTLEKEKYNRSSDNDKWQHTLYPSGIPGTKAGIIT